MAQTGGNRSALCHVTDGAFTVCPGGTQEWSDVTPRFSPEPSPSPFIRRTAYLYADQADLNNLATRDSPVDTLMLMYDECSRTARLGPNEYVRVGFTTVEVEGGVEALEHYVIHIFGNGTIIFIENGTPQTNAAGEVRVAEIEGQRGAVGFGPSPNCSFDHVFAEFEIKLSATGIALNGGYSPDPQFWSAEAPCDRKCRLNRCAAVWTAIGALSLACAANPLCLGVGIGSGLNVAIYWWLSADPPDPNFRIIAQPLIPPFSPVTVADAGTQEAADAVNALLDNQAHVVGLGSALLTSIERAQGAAAAGDAFWEREQMLAAALFATQEADLYDAQLVLLANARSSLQSAGFPSFAVTAADISAFKTAVAANGPPTVLTDALVLTSLASRSDGPQVLRDAFLSLDPNAAAGSFPEILTDPRLLAAIRDMAAGNREFARSVPGFVAPIRPGFDGNNLPANDDVSTGLVPIGFPLNFFGTTYDTLFVNNNGNVTFDSPLSTFTPFPLTSTNRAIIAPFFADVDTRVGNVVTYGQGTVDGRPAFGVNWPGVGCFNRNTGVLNFFQMRLIDRSDVGAGDFDIVFGYDSIQWETGQASGGDAVCQRGFSARVGYSNGTGNPGTFFELPGSGISGSFLDSNLQTGLRHQPPLRFSVRSGVPLPTADQDGDSAADEIDNCPTTPNADQADRNFNGIGDFCETGANHSTAAFLQAALDGVTSVEPFALRASEAPDLLEKLVRIVEFRVEAGLTNSAEELTQNLVNSQVEIGLVSPTEADALVADVLQQINQAPIAIAGPDQLVECTSSHGTTVALNGSASTDSDGDPLTFIWTGPFGTLVGEQVNATLPLGTHRITLTVSDGQGGIASDEVTVTVQDTTAPTVGAALVPIGDVDDDEGRFRVAFSCSDACDANVTITTATLNGIPVSNGQIVELEIDDDDQETEVDDGVLEVEASSFELVVTCRDSSGNVRTATAAPRFRPDDEDNDDDADDERRRRRRR